MNSFKLSRLASVLFGATLAFAASMTLAEETAAQRDATQATAEQSVDNNQTPLPVEELRAFAEVFGRIKSSYVEPVTDKELLTEAINGMLSGLDPHSAYLDEDAFKDLQVGTHGEFGGLGIEVGMEDGLVKVISPIEDTPAFRAGIKSGDLIIKIDDTLVKGLTLNEAVKRMRGKPGSKIRLTVLRKDQPAPKVITITRAVIKVKSVKSNLLEPGYGYVRVTQFQERTASSLADAIQALYQENKEDLKGLVLDLRNDPGGLLNAAVGVSAAFLEPGQLVVYTDGRANDSQMRLTASPKYYLPSGQDDFLQELPESIKHIPLIVLVNSGSASASEIVAGALQDHQRAVIMGTRTFGKGSVQTILPLGNKTAIKLTTARYFTPEGRSIQAKGIVPDIELEPLNPQSAHRIREADLEKHLTNGKEEADSPAADPHQQPADAVHPDKEDAQAKMIQLGSEHDVQLKQALNLLKGLQIFNRQ